MADRMLFEKNFHGRKYFFLNNQTRFLLGVKYSDFMGKDKII